MKYVKTFNEYVIKYPYPKEELREDFPRTSFPAKITDALLSKHSVFPVVELPAPDYNHNTHYLAPKGTPEFVNGRWVLGWNVLRMGAAERSAKRKELELAVRKEAARRLQFVGAEYTPEERETWATQVNEGKAILAGKLPDSNLLKNLAAARGTPLVDIAKLVIAKATAYANYGGVILGSQSKLLAMEEIPADFSEDKYWS